MTEHENEILSYIKQMLMALQGIPHLECTDYDRGRIDALRGVYRYIIGMHIEQLLRAQRTSAQIEDGERMPTGHA